MLQQCRSNLLKIYKPVGMEKKHKVRTTVVAQRKGLKAITELIEKSDKMSATRECLFCIFYEQMVRHAGMKRLMKQRCPTCNV